MKILSTIGAWILGFILLMAIGISCNVCDKIKDKEENKYYEISNIEELYAMESEKNYKLTVDLDLAGREWYPLAVKDFDGQGHQISNCFINSITEYSYTGFFKKARKIENTNFEKIEALIGFTNYKTGDKAYWKQNVGGLVVGDVEELSNVALSNSELSVTKQVVTCWIGGMAGYCSRTATNCRISNTSIRCVNAGDMVGGLLGGMQGSKMEKCTSEGVSIDVNYKDTWCAGLLVGASSGDVVSCYSRNGTITVKGDGSGAGIAGSLKGDISKCYSKNNVIEIIAESSYSIGGIACSVKAEEISDCLSDGNTLIGKIENPTADSKATIAGLFPSNEHTVTRCVVQNCTINGATNSVGSANNCGFIANVGASIVNCLANGNIVQGRNADAFSGETEMIHESYLIELGQTVNRNNVEVLSIEELSGIIAKLSLDSEIWAINNNLLEMKL